MGIPVHVAGVVIVAHGLDDIAARVIQLVDKIRGSHVGTHTVNAHGVELALGIDAIQAAIGGAAQRQQLCAILRSCDGSDRVHKDLSIPF